MDIEAIAIHDTALLQGNLEEWTGEAQVVPHGVVVHCLQGSVTCRVNFDNFPLKEGDGLIVFPNDVVQVTERSGDFGCETLQYDTALLREASLQMEHTVYSLLRRDRLRGGTAAPPQLLDNMFGLLRFFYAQQSRSFDQIVLYQLKVLFLGFYDFLLRHPELHLHEPHSSRGNELFAQFMTHLAQHYMQSRDVAFYAQQLHISSKYLTLVVQKKTGHNAKTVIDHYVVMQLKTRLRTSHQSIKQMAWDFHFNDVSFFCRYFKSHTGMSPQRFREAAAAEADDVSLPDDGTIYFE